MERSERTRPGRSGAPLYRVCGWTVPIARRPADSSPHLDRASRWTLSVSALPLGVLATMSAYASFKLDDADSIGMPSVSARSTIA